MTLPQLDADLFLTDGGLETTLVFDAGLDLPDFAAFPLLDGTRGQAALEAYYAPYLALAERLGRGIVLDTPTWRANPDWGTRLGYDPDRLAEVNRRSVGFVRALAAARPGLCAVLDGVVGPRGDGYVVAEVMSVEEAEDYHSLQLEAFAAAGADMATGVTLTYTAEAIGFVRAALTAGLPAVVSFTTDVDGRLPSGSALGEAITEVDEATEGAAAYFMLNCAHPTHFAEVLDPQAPWTARIKGVRANASTLSHEELDAAPVLDRGDVPALARHYAALRDRLPDLRVVGGCCGTDHLHVTAIATHLLALA